MKAAPPVTVEEYLRRTEKPNCEYIDGVLYPKALPLMNHSVVQTRLLLGLSNFGVEALPELTVQLSPTTYFVPDVAVAKFIQHPYPTEPVFLCAEILSPGEGVGAMLAKCEQYHDWGVPHCCVIDPERQTAWSYDSGGEPVHVDQSGALRAGELVVSLVELFKDLPTS